ncbi:TIGR02444 family protein [Pseudoalteromonas shioyasakiensis]|uniref:TIGR02444 family protein n=1 Tax=Pseudoalteromonas TaxID=53246 RepID=UPI00101FD6C9|nr:MULTISPECIES: TIGR02444 family protein [Pseudoalteromonas]MCQ8883631.1 TIGR02444 family protein [Pseudoalteromonas shioyasakiensis]RZD21474.1 TIGR02444 family protein [Pseudoalteromonas sp. MEBiC 03485]URQ90240.1 TIGR02444 family protein [Pseudoalteromonas sp. SCSIO 43101]
MKTLNSEEFWQFACQLYSKDGMQTKLLDYQNQQGKNVNLCLLLYYLDSLELAVTPPQLSELESCIAEFDQHALQPLRATRAYLKTIQTELPDYPTIRKELLSAELKLEKQQQQLLINTLNSMALSRYPNTNNIMLYISDKR